MSVVPATPPRMRVPGVVPAVPPQERGPSVFPATPRRKRPSVVRLLVAGVSLLASACDSTRDDVLQVAARRPGPVPPYITAAALDAADTSRIAWYGNALQAMGEPRLQGDTRDGETLRFLWLRTFHRPMVVRLEMGPRACLVVLTIVNGRSGEEFGGVYRSDSTLTGLTQCTIVRDALMAAGFEGPSIPPNKRERDGSEWVFELRTAERYRVVVRWSPEISTRDRPFAGAGRAFLELAAWDHAADDPIY